MLLLAAAVLLLAAAGGCAAAPSDDGGPPAAAPLKAGPKPRGAGLYVVQLKQAPAAVQARGQQQAKVAAAAAVVSKAQAVAARAGGVEVKVVYKYAMAGFAASLTPTQLEQLNKDPAVAAVYPDTVAETATAHTPDFLGLTGPSGAWSQLGGSERAGEGVIIGFVDSGILPSHPSFNGSGYSQTPPPGWRGACLDNASPPVCK